MRLGESRPRTPRNIGTWAIVTQKRLSLGRFWVTFPWRRVPASLPPLTYSSNAPASSRRVWMSSLR
jgi:hypothetical protein